jgi:hypothetical protein
MVRGGLLLGIPWDDVKNCKMTPICGWLMGWFMTLGSNTYTHHLSLSIIINLSIYLYIYQSINLSIYQSINLSIYLSIDQSLNLSIYVWMIYQFQSFSTAMVILIYVVSSFTKHAMPKRAV